MKLLAVKSRNVSDLLSPTTFKTTQTWYSNHGDPATLAIDFFEHQGSLPDGQRFDRNAGRRSLAAWLDSTHTPYHEGFEIHGDLK